MTTSYTAWSPRESSSNNGWQTGIRFSYDATATGQTFTVEFLYRSKLKTSFYSSIKWDMSISNYLGSWSLSQTGEGAGRWITSEDDSEVVLYTYTGSLGTMQRGHSARDTSISCRVSINQSGYDFGGPLTATYTDTLSPLASYQVSYNANGGTGSVAPQTKWHGETLVLANGGFTKPNYAIDGWATSASGAKAYNLGANYTANAAATLYAHWVATYRPPQLGELTVYRCSQNALPAPSDPQGTKLFISLPYTLDPTVSSQPDFSVYRRERGAANWTLTTAAASSKSGGVVMMRSDAVLDQGKMYDIRVDVTDSKGGSASVFGFISTSFTLIDIYDNRNMGLGAVASEGAGTNLTIGFDTEFTKPIDGGLKPYQLFSGDTLNAVSLLDDATKYSWIAITYRDSSSRYCTDFIQPVKGRRYCIERTVASSSGGAMYHASKVLELSSAGTSLTVADGLHGQVTLSASGVSFSGTNTHLYVTSVVGYK